MLKDVPRNILHELFDYLDEGILITDGAGNILAYNQTWYILAGFGNDATTKVPPNIYNIVRTKKIIAKVVLEEKRDCIDIIKTPTGELLLSKGRPIFNQTGEIEFVIVSCRNLSSAATLCSESSRENGKIQKLYKKYMEHERAFDPDQPIYASPAMTRLFMDALTISQTDATVLLQGESGIGKEVVSHFIFQHSNRKDKPYLTVNCGAIPSNLLESEFFGYAPGAFTGASKKGKAGLFEAASGGTLLLDEIGELPLDMQVKLLRVLETQQITRVGDTTPIQVNVRIIAATNQDLLNLVKAGKFRRDLFYRINIIPIHIPPLRQRKDDIIVLANHFVNVFNVHHMKDKEISLPGLKILAEYTWPGNVRELRNVMERLVIFSEEKVISPQLIRQVLYQEPQLLDEGGEGKLATVHQLAPMNLVVEDVERQLLTMASEKYKTTRSIAHELDISQTTAVRKLKKYQIGSAE